MTGTFNHRDERLRRQAQQELQARPPLPTWQRRVVERFAVERGTGWYTLLSQFAPDTPPNRPDVVLSGPQGVLAVMLREEEPAWEDSRAAFVWTAELLAGVPTPHGMLTEAALRTVVVVPAHAGRARSGHSGEHLLIAENELDRVLVGGERVLEAADALSVARHLGNSTFDLTPIGWNAQHIPAQRGAGETGVSGRSSGLFEVAQLREERFERAVRGPFQDWRIFLDDSQLGLVRRQYSGPARITGPAGTGKTVLALHRLAYLARRSTGELLYTTHLRNLPRIAEKQFRSLAEQVRDRVRFQHLHGWAREFLVERGRDAEVDEQQIDEAFRAVWERTGAGGPLATARPSRAYWKDEIDRVIKGRGLGTLEAYRHAPRRGRGGNLTPGFRAHVWEFYCEYERELSERGVYDHNDVLMRALDELGRRPLERRFTAVVVDEVQDLTLIGLRLVHAISGDAPNQLLLVGDGQQQIYAGGWRLSEAGISLSGRGEVLRRNYRNRTTIVDEACDFDAVNRFDDLDGGPAVTMRSALPVLGGGRAVHWHGADQEDALVDALRALDDPSDAAVLTRTNNAAAHWEQVLRQAGFQVSPLDRWEGGPSAAVHVGTVHRAKGTEFRSVFLPDEPRPVTSYREEAEAGQRQALVAVTRARDYVWIGKVETR
ncbi:DEAD/DEAH box helicase [Saccharopolyspora erythraea]|uniref:UvrD-helicase domain-containing protein n=1 Tax=Saccharopolyspora erythraea TaxID=1836 RepID=UPI001BAE19A4|nr:UvrD-helicase domain-containing protein [Saccharopolyspora erythraea]QUH00361.1 DEAD/DEAH box helicase [Saccharopolyspora erythraea]